MNIFILYNLIIEYTNTKNIINIISNNVITQHHASIFVEFEKKTTKMNDKNWLVLFLYIYFYFI